MKNKKDKVISVRTKGLATLLVCLFMLLAAQQVDASTSTNVAMIGSPTVMSGGSLPTTVTGVTFTNLAPANVNAANLASYDTAVLNVASAEIRCNIGTLSTSAKTDLVNFVKNGGKLIIYDSECSSQDYSWLPVPFTTNNPGAMGASGTLTIVEENTLSSSNPLSPYYIDAAFLGSSTDAVGDMNVMTTQDPNWCLDMSGTNYNKISGPVHTYAKYPFGTDKGLIIYNGLDVDMMGYGTNTLEKMWAQELGQQFNPSNLPCGKTVVGITLTPTNATNPVGTTHTVTATISDVLGNPISGTVVSFKVISGPNVGLTFNGTTGANGQISWTYTSNGVAGTDEIQASFVDVSGKVQLSQIATKVWTQGTPVQPGAEGFMTGGGSVLNAIGANNKTIDRVTHGFKLNCNKTQTPNNLEINWGKGNKFHLETLDTATCSDDAAITPNPPSAGFDTYKGAGTGKYNGVAGATAEWTFTDAGEPGRNDTATIQIRDVNGNVVLIVSGKLQNGNQQAHNST